MMQFLTADLDNRLGAAIGVEVYSNDNHLLTGLQILIIK